MTNDRPVYLSYLLRLWGVSDQNKSQAISERAAWRASLEDPHTGQRQGFASLDDLFEFLRAQIELPSQNASPQVDGRRNQA